MSNADRPCVCPLVVCSITYGSCVQEHQEVWEQEREALKSALVTATEAAEHAQHAQPAAQQVQQRAALAEGRDTRTLVDQSRLGEGNPGQYAVALLKSIYSM